MTKKLLIATRNAGKVRELKQLYGQLPDLTLVTMSDFPDVPDVVEDGDTFIANASKKARELAAATSMLVLADDSGLEVDALGGRPGVWSARYAGTHGDDEANNLLLLKELADIPDELRTARYRVVLALADAHGKLGTQIHTEDGACEGTIIRTRRGDLGFGYDPYFVPAGFTQTMAELTHDEKNRISHRALASEKMLRFLASYL